MPDGALRDALRRAMIAALRANSDALALCGGRIYPEEAVPEDVLFPRYYLGYRPGRIEYIGSNMKNYYPVIAVRAAVAQKSSVDVAGTVQDMLTAANTSLHNKLGRSDVPGLRWLRFTGEEQPIPGNTLREQFVTAADRYTGFLTLVD